MKKNSSILAIIAVAVVTFALAIVSCKKETDNSQHTKLRPPSG